MSIVWDSPVFGVEPFLRIPCRRVRKYQVDGNIGKSALRVLMESADGCRVTDAEISEARAGTNLYVTQ